MTELNWKELMKDDANQKQKLLQEINSNEYQQEKKDYNYIYKLAESYYLLDKRMEYDVAFQSGNITLSACCPNVRIPSSRGISSLDAMTIIIGTSGAIKTSALRRVIEVMRALKLKLPSFPTTEGCSDYFAEKDKGDNFVHKPYGCIIEDELSGKFKQANVKQYMAGSIEMFAKLYDHNLEDVHLVSDFRYPQQPYVSLLGATIDHFIPDLPNHLFAQGLAGRFNWVYIDAENIKFDENEDITDTKNFEKATFLFNKHILKFKELLEVCSDMKNINILEMDEEVNHIFMEFDKECHDKWKYHAVNNPFGWGFQYIKRLSEMAIKQAGRFCIGRNINHIIKNGFDDNISINSRDLELGIKCMQNSDSHLKKIFTLKIKGEYEKKIFATVPQYYRQNTTEQLFIMLEKAPNQMLNSGQWQEMTRITNANEFGKLKKILLEKNKVRLVEKKEIIDSDEKERLHINSSATKVYTLVK